MKPVVISLPQGIAIATVQNDAGEFPGYIDKVRKLLSGMSEPLSKNDSIKVSHDGNCQIYRNGWCDCDADCQIVRGFNLSVDG
jgi:hypothetical protein